MRSGFCACALLVLWAVAGCSSPAPNIPAVAASARWDADSRAASWPSGDWWHEYRSDALDGLIAQARATNFDLNIALARVRQAEAQVNIASAGLYPTLVAQAQAQRSRNSPPSATGSSGAGQGLYSARFAAAYQVDFWGANASSARAAAALARASQFDRQTVELTIESAVAAGYFDVCFLRERLSLARANLANAEKTLQAIRARAAAGIASELDVAQEESVVDQQRAALPSLELQLKQSLTGLAILVGRAPEGFDVATGDASDVHLPQVGGGVPSGLLTRRPDIQSARAQLESASASLGAAEAARFPSVTLSAATGYGATEAPRGLIYHRYSIAATARSRARRSCRRRRRTSQASRKIFVF